MRAPEPADRHPERTHRLTWLRRTLSPPNAPRQIGASVLGGCEPLPHTALAPHVGSQLAWDVTAGPTGWPLDIHLLTQQHLKAAADEGGLARGN